MRAFFYDTWAFLALADRRDRHHALAVEVDRWLEDAGYAAVTTDYVLDETLTGLQLGGGHRASLAFLDLVTARIDGADLLALETSVHRRAAGAALFRRLAPEEPRLSFTDCCSMAVMRELGIELAFTMDRHFHRGGNGIRPLVQLPGGIAVAVYPK